MVKQFMPKAGEAILALFSKLGGNMNNVLGSRSNITFLGKGKNTEAFLDSNINIDAIGVLGKDKILKELESSIGYLTAGKLNDVQANKLLANMTKIDEVFNPRQIPNITDMATGTRNLDQEGLGALRAQVDDVDLPPTVQTQDPNFIPIRSDQYRDIFNKSPGLKNVDLPPPGSRGGPDDIAAPFASAEDTIAELNKAVAIANATAPGTPAKRATAREFLVEALKEDDTFATKLGSVVSAEDVKYITEGGGGIMGDPLVLVEKYFGPRILEMIPSGASNEEIIIFTKRIMNNVEDAAGLKPDNPRFDRFTARIVDIKIPGGPEQPFAKGGLAKILEV